MNTIFKDLLVIELSSVLAGPSVGLFFQELGAKVIKIENPKTNGDVTRSWKLKSEDFNDSTSAYFWSVNAGKEILSLDLFKKEDLELFYEYIKKADIIITNNKYGDDVKLKVDYKTLSNINPEIIYASINGFGENNPRTAYDLILQAESGFMYMNGESNSLPLKMPVALIDILAGHQLKEAILIALLRKHKTNLGSNITVSLFDSAIASLANQATNWLIANYLPEAQGSLHPNIAPYGELFTTSDYNQITFAIGSDHQFKSLCKLLNSEAYLIDDFSSNQNRVKNREELYNRLNAKIRDLNFDYIYEQCHLNNIPIGKIRNLKEVFELPEAKLMLNHITYQGKPLDTVNSIAFKIN